MDQKMTRKTAVFFLPDDMTRDSAHTPLLLQSVYFCPILTWMSEELTAAGVERFFIVCDRTAEKTVLPLFPEGKSVFVDGAQHGTLLREALEKEGGRVVIVNGLALPVGLFGGGAVYEADAAACCQVLEAHGAFAAVPAGAKLMDGFLPIGDAQELREALPLCREKILKKHLDGGVQIMDESNTYIDPRVKIGRGTVLLPGTILRGRTVIGCDCEIGPSAMVRDCTVGDRTVINASQLNESTVGSDTNVGPFCYVRPGSVIGDHVKAGDFVEIKNSTIGNGTKISHLTYVGDSDVGCGVNFGCGTVTTNYDGFHKFRTTIEDDAFIGCNTNLVAPVKVGQGSYIAAGSTITKDVPPDSLAVARTPQTVKEDWAARRRRLMGK